MRWRTRLPALVCVLLFLGALAAPLVDRRLRPDRWQLVRGELRNPAAWPPFDTLQCWVDAPERLRQWFGDALGLREELVHGANRLAVEVFARAPHPNLELGRRGFVFYAGDRSRDTWRGQAPLSRDELEGWAEAIRLRRESLAELGVQYVFCIAPNKETIYPENLRAGEEQLSLTPLGQLDALCRQRGEPAWLDLRPALLAEKGHDDPAADDWSYLRLGSHWSYRGGEAAMREIARALADRVRGLAPLPRESWRTERVDEYNREDSLMRSMHLDEQFHEPQIELVRVGGTHARVLASEPSERDPQHPSRSETCNDDPGLPTIYLLHDSFGQWIRAALAEHASRSWTRWVYGLPLNEIAELHPDLVVQLVTERHLHEKPEPTERVAELLDAQAFAALPLVRGRDELLGAVRPYLASEIVRSEQGLRFSPRVGADKLLVPLGPLAPGARAVLHLELELERAGDLFLWYQRGDDPRFLPRRRVARTLAPGRVTLDLVVPGANPPGELLLQPTSSGGTVLLRALELRALGP